ncbi:MAG: Ni/Fe hydrogenase subunit alpha [Candidatus Buchananbacteria bacterium]
MKIQVNHIGKMEGHTDFVAQILGNNVKQAKFITTEGSRLIEGLLVGRHYYDAPIITARICGICPVVHNLTSIKAIENALGLQPTNQTILLRKLMQYGQIIHSHGLHLFFLSLPDFFDLNNDLKFVKKYPVETQAAMRLRDFGLKLLALIGGRAIHPIASEVGGFKKYPDLAKLKNLNQQIPELLTDAKNIFNLTQKIKYPVIKRHTEFIALKDKTEYAIYQGDLVSTNALHIPAEKYAQVIKEIQKPYEAAKRAEYLGGTFMVGALARINNNHQQLNPLAKKLLRSLAWDFPVYNTFMNIPAQAIEIVHLLEECQKLLNNFNTQGLKVEVSQAQKLKLIGWANPLGKTTAGVGAIEAPRGTLYHHYLINRDGIIEQADIITPTVQFLDNIEEDIKVYLPNITKLKPHDRQIKIRALIRAYDPCISCATH